jgi:hypothetical protein
LKMFFLVKFLQTLVMNFGNAGFVRICQFFL